MHFTVMQQGMEDNVNLKILHKIIETFLLIKFSDKYYSDWSVLYVVF